VLNDKFDELLRSGRFHVFLMALSLFFFLVACTRTELGSSEPSAYWYASSLSLTFYIGLVLSAFTLLLSFKQSWPMRLVSIVLPVLFLYGVPALLHDLPPVYDIYHVIPTPLEILETGQHDIQESPFPLSHIFWASNLEILKIEPLRYARLFPLIFASSIALCLYSTAARLSKRWACMAPLAFLSMYWYMEAHMARQSFTLIIWTSFIFALFFYLYTKDLRWGGITIFFSITVLLSHPGQTIFIFFNLAALSFVSVLFIMNKEIWDHLKPVHIITAAAALFFLTLYYHIKDIQDFFQGLYENIGDRGFEGMDLGYRIESSECYDTANSIRSVKMVSQSLLGLGAALLAYIRRDRKAITVGIIFLSCYLWLVYPLTHHGRYLERTFMAALIPASILITYLLAKMETLDRRKLKTALKTSLVVFVIVLLVTIPISKNSIDSFETPSMSGLEAGRFVYENHEGRVYMTDTHEGLFRYIEATEDGDAYFRSVSGGQVEAVNGVKTGYNRPRTTSMWSNQLFLDYYKNYFSVRFGNETIVEEIDDYEERYSEQQARIYDSGGARFYKEA